MKAAEGRNTGEVSGADDWQEGAEERRGHGRTKPTGDQQRPNSKTHRSWHIVGKTEERVLYNRLHLI